MNITMASTTHALERMQQRQIPMGIVDLITTFGESINAGDGARKYALANKSLKKIRRVYGHGIAKAMHSFRLVYVVEADGKIITTAFSKRPLFNQ
jgi:hypothetical protein